MIATGTRDWHKQVEDLEDCCEEDEEANYTYKSRGRRRRPTGMMLTISGLLLLFALLCGHLCFTRAASAAGPGNRQGQLGGSHDTRPGGGTQTGGTPATSLPRHRLEGAAAAIGRASPSSIRNVTAQNGQTVLFHCPLDAIGSSSGVSWFKGAVDPLLLSIDVTMVVDDERFQVFRGHPGADDWAFQIRAVDRHSDGGLYMCQTHEEPPRTHFYQLSVVEPQVHIVGAPDMAVKLGSPINLTCVISQPALAKERPIVFWYRDQTMINYDLGERRRLSHWQWQQPALNKPAESADFIASNLQIHHSKLTDSANYTCQPEGLRAVSVYVHVLEGPDKRLIMFQNDGQATAASSSSQQTNSAAASLHNHVIQLSRAPFSFYALLLVGLLCHQWLQLATHLATGIILLLLAIIGLMAGHLADRTTGGDDDAEDRKGAASDKFREASKKVPTTTTDELVKRMNGSKSPVLVGLKPLTTSPSSSASSSSASTGYNTDTARSARLVMRLQQRQQHDCDQDEEQTTINNDEDEQMIELVGPPTALHLIMDELNGTTSDLRLRRLRQTSPTTRRPSSLLHRDDGGNHYAGGGSLDLGAAGESLASSCSPEPHYSSPTLLTNSSSLAASAPIAAHRRPVIINNGQQAAPSGPNQFSARLAISPTGSSRSSQSSATCATCDRPLA